MTERKGEKDVRKIGGIFVSKKKNNNNTLAQSEQQAMWRQGKNKQFLKKKKIKNQFFAFPLPLFCFFFLTSFHQDTQHTRILCSGKGEVLSYFPLFLPPFFLPFLFHLVHFLFFEGKEKIRGIKEKKKERKRKKRKGKENHQNLVFDKEIEAFL